MPNVQLKSVVLPNGETMGYRERKGGEKTLLLIHGNMTSSKHWDVFIEAMPEKYKIYAVDLRGFGMSSYHQPIETLRDFSEDLKMFADELCLERFFLMGWSMGGGVGMQFAADYPDRVEKLVLLASVSTRGYPFFEIDKKGMPVRRLTTLEEVKKDSSKTIPIQHAYDMKDKDFLRQVWNMMIYTDHKPSEKKYDEYLEDMFTQRNLAEVYQALNIFNISVHDNGVNKGTGAVRRIQAPVLVLWGKNDLVVTETMTKEIVEDLGDRAKLVYLKGCGHSPLVDDLEQLIQETNQFLMS